MFWRLKTQIPSKQPWNGLLSSYFKVSQISYTILCFLSCTRITLCSSKKTYAGSLWEVPSIGQLTKIIWGGGTNKQSRMCVKCLPRFTVSAELARPELFHGLGAASMLTAHQLPPAPPPSCPKSSASLTVLLWCSMMILDAWLNIESKK